MTPDEFAIGLPTHLDPHILFRHAWPGTGSPTPAAGDEMVRKCMRVGAARCTSVKLEPVFWEHLGEIAHSRGMRLSALVSEVAAATSNGANLASALRTFALRQARLRPPAPPPAREAVSLELHRLDLARSERDLARVIEACPAPCLVLDAGRGIRLLNGAFAAWLGILPAAALGLRLDNLMVLRGAGMDPDAMWAALAGGRLMRGGLAATYVSPRRVCRARAVTVALGGGRGGYAVLFEAAAAPTAHAAAMAA